MADVKWIKLCTDVFDDEKIQLIDALPDRDGVLVIWFKLLCLAGKQNNGGVFMLNDKIAYTDEMLATIFRRPLNTVRLALSTFESFGMIEIVNNTITIPNWEKHQNLKQLEAAKENTRKRVAKYREKQKLTTGGNECNALRNAEVTQTDKEKKRKEKEKDLDTEAEVVCADAHDDNADVDEIKVWKERVMLSERQVNDLLDKMGLEAFDEYVDRLNDFIISRSATVKNHYATILKWYNEDVVATVCN